MTPRSALASATTSARELPHPTSRIPDLLLLPGHLSLPCRRDLLVLPLLPRLKELRALGLLVRPISRDRLGLLGLSDRGLRKYW